MEKEKPTARIIDMPQAVINNDGMGNVMCPSCNTWNDVPVGNRFVTCLVCSGEMYIPKEKSANIIQISADFGNGFVD